MMVELPESAAHVATDPNRVYYVGAGGNPCRLPGLLSFHLTRPCLRLCPSLRSAHNMLDGLRQGLVRAIRSGGRRWTGNSGVLERDEAEGADRVGAPARPRRPDPR